MKNLSLLLFFFGISSSIHAQCVAGNCLDGYGTWKWESGSVYTGEFKDNKPNGYGHYTFSNGDTYTGEWKNNERHGYGVYNYSNKEGYKSYAGEWKAGARSGMGIMYYKDEKISPKFGMWENNNFLYKYETTGCVEGDCEHGKGVFVWNDGSRYEGDFKNGERNGTGVYYYNSGAKYVGEQKNGGRNGVGTYYYPNGDKFIGEWKDERKVTGVMHTKDGIKELNSSAKTNTTSAIIKIVEPHLIAVENDGLPITVNEKRVGIEGLCSSENKVERIRFSGSISEMTNISQTEMRFVGTINLEEGKNTFWVEVTDRKGNVTKRSFVMVYEPE